VVAVLLAIRFNSGSGKTAVWCCLVLSHLVVSRRYPQIGLAVCTLSFSYMLVLTNLMLPEDFAAIHDGAVYSMRMVRKLPP